MAGRQTVRQAVGNNSVWQTGKQAARQSGRKTNPPRVHLISRMCVVGAPTPPSPQVHTLDHLFGRLPQVVVLVPVVVPPPRLGPEQGYREVEGYREVPGDVRTEVPLGRRYH